MRPLLPSDPNRVGRYRMLARLGIGGMGRVFLGSGPDGRLVALKLVSEDWLEDEGFRDRFRGEVAASRKVSGAYTAAVIDADAEAAMPWLASEFVPGITLAEAVTKAGKLPEAAVLRLAAGLAAALAVIHREDLVHRDLKPNNILLTDDGLRVIDFGIARATDNHGASGFTRTGRIVGTAGYMSPEQAEGKTVTPASDVFCLGTVLAMACTGAGPFDGNSDPQTMYNVVHKEPKLDEVPPRVRDLVSRCLDKDPVQRPGPDQVLESIGELDPTGAPWPQAVHDVIARLRTEVDTIIKTPGWTVSLSRVVDRTKMLTGLNAGQPRRPAADAVNNWYDAAEKQFRKLLSARGKSAPAGTNPPGTPPDPAGTQPNPAGTRPNPAGTQPNPAGTWPNPAGTQPNPAGTRPNSAGTQPNPAGTRPNPAATAPSPAQARSNTTATPNPAVVKARNIAIIVAGALAGMFVAADLNIGAVIDGDRAALGIGGSELEQALTHAGYFGAVAGFLLGGFAAALLRWIVGKRAQRFARISLAVAAGLGFVLGWLAEHDYLRVDLVSLGVMEDVSGDESEAALIVLGVLVSFIAMGCALWVIGRAIAVLSLIFFIPAAVVGAAWAYLGATGIVIDGGLSIGVASVIGATIGGGVAARVINSIRDRKPAPPPAPPKARAW